LNDMIMSRTAHGLREFFRWNFLANATGALQLLTQFASYHLFGTSIFSLRYSAVVIGCVFLLVLYLVVRRYAGRRPALLAAVIAAFAPEQLYWSRQEVTHFIVAVLAGGVTLWICHAMMRRLSLLTALVAALWMPFSRLLYIAGWVLFALPPVAAAHSLLFGRTRRLKALYVLPVLAAGVVLWAATPTLLRRALIDPDLPFVSPINVYGQSFVMQQGEMRETTTAGIVRAQIVSIAAHARDVAATFFDNCGRFTHWYIRVGMIPDHTTVTDAALAVWAFCGLFYLLTQVGDVRAVTLWGLVALGAAPALMSPIPFARRMLLVFVALPIGAAIFAAVLVRLAREAGARAAAIALRATAMVAALCVAATSATSYFMLPMGVSDLLAQIRFARPLFARDDAIFHNLSFGEDGNRGLGVAFGNLDALLARDIDFQFVEAPGWLAAALRLQPRFSGYLTRLTLDEERRADLAAHREVRHASFLLRDVPESAPPLQLLSELYPDAERRSGDNLVALSIDAAAAERRRRPRVLAAPDAEDPTTPLVGFTATERATSGDAARVEAGLLIENDAWYGWRLQPDCAGARLTIDESPVEWGAVRPLLRGVHALSLSLPSACPPVALRRSTEGLEAVDLGAGDLVSPGVAALPAAQPRAMAEYDGFTDARVLIDLGRAAVDFAADPDGGLSVLTTQGTVSTLSRFTATGAPRGRWTLQGEEPVFSLAIAADGTHAILSLSQIRWYTRDGDLLASSSLEAAGPACDVVFWGEFLLVNHPGRGSILVFARSGEQVAEWKIWPGMKEALFEPWSLAADGHGRLLLRDSSRRAFLVRSPPEKFLPRGGEIFAVDSYVHGAAFAGERIVVPAQRGFEVFRDDGTRMMAVSLARDLSDTRFGAFPRAEAVGDLLYALDREAGRVWRIRW